MAELAEVSRSQHYAPGSIEPVTVLQTLEQAAMGVEDVHKSQSRSTHRIVLGRILLGIGDVDVGTNGLNVEGRKAIADALIRESSVVIVTSQSHLLEVRVKNIDLSAPEVGGQN